MLTMGTFSFFLFVAHAASAVVREDRPSVSSDKDWTADGRSDIQVIRGRRCSYGLAV